MHRMRLIVGALFALILVGPAGAQAPAARPPAPAAAAPAPVMPATILVNVNTATVDELQALSGIGPARAAEIVKNRPYIDKKDLVSKAGIPQSTFDGIKARVVLVDLNHATAEDMIKILDGIGTARAAAIVKNRPYRTADEIVAKAGVPQAVFDGFKDEVVVTPPAARRR